MHSEFCLIAVLKSWFVALCLLACTDRLCEETSATTKRTSFTLDHAVRFADEQCRRNESLTYMLETEVPRLHFNVDGAREERSTAEPLQNEEDFDIVAVEILEEQGREEEETSSGGEPDDVVSDGISHSQCLEFLFNLLNRNLEDRETICSTLLDMAEHVNVLPPGNEPLPLDVLSMTQWKVSLWELVKEMKTVKERCPSLMRTSGVFVLTTSPYSAFLRALAAEIVDAAEKKIQLDN